ncbi:hypothetical protein N7516_005989 [Penicillium verrucosum]|uniref:Uncharacterized protein n=1 Tax=Penicillium nordicum TaxID=229535 RepID=A0A0M8P8Q5_9EURO|nr:uncharacterized protein N7516_005989 [Penicillium verrucosum]KAJ5931500.1 hypothetical protein N7516_005989 [Penicillium verrucosum]KOS47606.1 hypothetical protein ACN38_g1403 [Penicillium nordicum]
MTSLITICWSCAPVATAVVSSLGLALFALVLVVLYSRAHRGLKHTADLEITQGSMIKIPTWQRSYGLDIQQPYRRESYEFEDV